MRTFSPILAFLCAILIAGRPCSAENPILRDLLARGIPVSANQWVRLPQPALPHGLSAAAQRERIEAIAENRYAWEDLVRRTVVAPFVLKTLDDGVSGPSPGRRVDLYFVAYGKLDYLGSDEFLNSQFDTATQDAETASSARLLKEADLQRRRLPVPTRPEDPRFVAAEITLFERVRVSATTCTIKTRTADSIVLASILDPGFANDPEFPDRWWPIVRDASGHRRLGDPQPYFGLGSYVKATRLVEPQGAIFIEYHVAYAEPKEWFNGANLLRSKLPIAAQTAVRKLRRNLERAP